MNHLCLIVDNSATMSQRGVNNVAVLDYVKDSVEVFLLNLLRRGFPSSDQYIHLFVTSSPTLALSSFQHDQKHLNFQLKHISPQMPTDPTETVCHALDHISRFRILSEAQTLLGYRQALPYDPALIFFFTDKLTLRKLNKLTSSVNRITTKTRSQYRFIVLRLTPPSFSEKNLYTEEKFRNHSETQPQSILLAQVCHNLGWHLKHIYSYEGLIQAMHSTLQTIRPSLKFKLQQRQLKRKIVQVQSISQPSRIQLIFKQNPNLLKCMVEVVPISIQWRALLPFTAKCSDDQCSLVDQVSKLVLSVDFTKQYKQLLPPTLHEAKYKIEPTPLLSSISQLADSQFHFPLFFDYKKCQCLIGLLHLSKDRCQMSLYCPNFHQLISIIKCYGNAYNYNVKTIQTNSKIFLSSIPPYYNKYVSQFSDVLRMNIDCSEVLSGALQQQYKAKAMRMSERSRLRDQFQGLKELHGKYKASCCRDTVCEVVEDPVKVYYEGLLTELFEMKRSIGIKDYFTVRKLEDVLMAREIEKYSTVNAATDFTENIHYGLGNPFPKRRKYNQEQKLRAKSIQLVEIQTISIGSVNQYEQKHTQIIEQIKENNTMDEEKCVNKIQTLFIQNAVLNKINSMVVNKGIEVKFNASHIDESLMLRNVKILKKYIP